MVHCKWFSGREVGFIHLLQPRQKLSQHIENYPLSKESIIFITGAAAFWSANLWNLT